MIRIIVLLQSTTARLPKLVHGAGFIAVAVLAGVILFTGCHPEEAQLYGHSHSEARHSDSYDQ